MTDIVNYTFEGKAKDLKFSHIPTNGGVILVKIDGYEFEVCMLNGTRGKERTYMARMQKEYSERRVAMLSAQGIELK